MTAFSRKKYTVFAALFTGAALLALVTPAPVWFDAPLALLYIGGNGWLLGSRIFPEEPLAWRIFLGALTLLAALITIGAGVYFFKDLGPALSAVVIAITPLLGVCIPSGKDAIRALFNRKPDARDDAKIPFVTVFLGMLLVAVVALLVAYGISLLSGSATDLTMRSPWDAVPRVFFTVVFMAVLAAFIAAYSGYARGATAILAMMAVMVLGTLVAALVYKIGFGFDPFIHQATENAILANGVVYPKPFYYLGQYALVTLIARVTGAGVMGIDTMLVPIGVTLTIPVAYWSLRRAFAWDAAIALATASGLLLLPLSSFIMTTPQGLANLLLLLTAFLALPAVAGKGFPRLILVLFAAAATAVHPLAGIPLILFVGIVLFLTIFGPTRGKDELGRRIVLAEIIIIGSIALPLVFLLNSFISPASVQIDTEAFRAPADVISLLVSGDAIRSRQFQAAFDLVYFWRSARFWLLLLTGLAGLFLLRRERKVATVYGISFIVFTVNYLLLKTLIRFPFLIDYEQTNYADRLVDLSVFLVAPLALFAFGSLLQRLRSSFPALRIGIAVMIATLATSSVYLAYPRRDTYESSRGWSTSAADIEAVRSIAEDAGDRDYIVLANQALSAGAIRDAGFRKYYDSKDPDRPGQLFYYPIPTGEALYGEFLAMNDAEGDPAVALEAMDLVDVDTVYYAVNHYWWDAQAITVAAQRSADAWWSIDDKVFVFRYSRESVSQSD